MGYADENIVLDIINAWTHTENQFDDLETINNLLRYRSFKQYFSKLNDIVEFMQAFPNIDFRYYFHPSEKFKGNMMQFDSKNTIPVMNIGKKDGSNLELARKQMEDMKHGGG